MASLSELPSVLDVEPIPLRAGSAAGQPPGARPANHKDLKSTQETIWMEGCSSAPKKVASMKLAETTVASLKPRGLKLACAVAFALLLGLFCWPATAHAQGSVQVSGTVADSNAQGVQGVSVYVRDDATSADALPPGFSFPAGSFDLSSSDVTQDFRLPPVTTLTVMTDDANGSPVAGVPITSSVFTGQATIVPGGAAVSSLRRSFSSSCLPGGGGLYGTSSASRPASSSRCCCSRQWRRGGSTMA